MQPILPLNQDDPTPEALRPPILLGCFFGLIAGAFIGAIGLLIWGILSGSVISVGFGLLGLVYLPIGGAVGGGIIGSILGACLAFVLRIKPA
jgi:hypothetical protein